MKVLNSKIHGVIDYSVGLMLLASPLVLGRHGIAVLVPQILGAVALLYSALTHYELGLYRWIPFRFHLSLDVIHAIVLGSSPWTFGFSQEIWVPHLVLGIAELTVVSITRASVNGKFNASK